MTKIKTTLCNTFFTTGIVQRPHKDYVNLYQMHYSGCGCSINWSRYKHNLW